MKKTLNSIFLVLFSLLLSFSVVACGSSDDSEAVEKTDLWENATYTSDTVLGEGEKTLVVEVSVEGRSAKFTIKTDKSTVGEALLEHNLIAGDDGQYGMYVKEVNGITADFDVNKSYWAFYIDGEYAMTGVDKTEISDGAAYKLEYTK